MGIGVAKAQDRVLVQPTAQVQFPHPLHKDPATQCTNGWQLAEVNGDADPYSIQYLLNRARRWRRPGPPCAARAGSLGDSQTVGIIDETAFLKKGIHSAGVARQYSGTAGRVEHCQVGIFLAYAGARGYTLLDAELYLPKG